MPVYLWDFKPFFLDTLQKCTQPRERIQSKKIFSNINISTIIIAITLFFAKIRLPEIITGTLGSVGAMIGPVSMFVTGMLIGGMELKKILTDKRTYFISFMRLITIPLIALLILKISGLKGWNKDGEQILLIVFMAVISPVASTDYGTASCFFHLLYKQCLQQIIHNIRNCKLRTKPFFRLHQ